MSYAGVGILSRSYHFHRKKVTFEPGKLFMNPPLYEIMCSGLVTIAVYSHSLCWRLKTYYFSLRDMISEIQILGVIKLFTKKIIFLMFYENLRISRCEHTSTNISYDMFVILENIHVFSVNSSQQAGNKIRTRTVVWVWINGMFFFLVNWSKMYFYHII